MDNQRGEQKRIILNLLRRENDLNKKSLARRLSEQTGFSTSYISQLKSIEKARRKMMAMYFKGEEE